MLTFLRLKRSKFGGAENYLSRLTDELSKHNVKFTIKYSSAPKFLPSWLKIIWYNLEVCLGKKDIYFSFERVICPDIYRAGDGVHKVFLQTIKKSKFNPLHYVYLFIEKRMFQNAKIIIANSNMIKHQITTTYNISPNKIITIYNGIKLKPLSNADDIKKEFNITNEKILLYVGSGFERKGVKEVIQIASYLDGDYKLFIVGKEKRIKWYQDYAKQLGVNAIFTNTREDVDKFYSLADVFVFPTHYEPFSNVVLEAMSFKCAVITTAQNGASEILPEEFVMKNPKDYKIELLKKLLTNPSYLQSIKEQNYQIASQFTIEKNAKETLKVIQQVLKDTK
ncbi:MAG: glycosyltransferase family 4 protein [Epsilonproteobacteria bacterium]|nr:glycosyltransferase family 4 protein [Campylobacterota bacterium]